MNSGYLKLRNAIIMQTYIDMKRIIRDEIKYGKNQMQDCEYNKCLIFLKSDWFETLTDIDYNIILKRLAVYRKNYEKKFWSEKNDVNGKN